MRINWGRLAGSVVAGIIVAGCIFGTALVVHPESPLPKGWNPLEPLHVTDTPGPLTHWKLQRAMRDPLACRAAVIGITRLKDAAGPAEPRVQCQIADPVEASEIANATVTPFLTNCGTALATTMWIFHGVQPLADAYFGSPVRQIFHLGSYNCRQIRTLSGPSNRWSTHATARAIDVTGFQLADGREVDLASDWDDGSDKSEFLRNAQSSGCRWFTGVLGPDFNALHADHFHFQLGGSTICR